MMSLNVAGGHFDRREAAEQGADPEPVDGTGE
jgi:hypothetical protein